ncbi:FCD domain-containing protein [Streptomyces sp. NPDC004610]|uniref:FadR/GntR family transcriptional regulator n=1 Tax=unclassified Streptomyces TaxID=2593676 RepID=UPI0033B5CE51
MNRTAETMMEDDNTLSPVRQIAAHELVVEQIRRSIEIGQFLPGDRLPPERELAETLDVSRTTVRSAIAVLEREDMISVRRGRGGGFLVLEPTYDLAATRQRLQRDRAAMQAAFEFRVIVESGAARLAAERRLEEDLAPLSQLVDRMRETIEGARQETRSTHLHEYNVLDSSFHLGIAQASGSRHLARAVDESRRRMFLPVGAIFGRIDSAGDEAHAEILAAIEAKDSEASARLMTEHISRTRETFEAWLNR